MAEFDPERFEEKYVHYLDELQAAYRNAFNQLHGRYDSTLLRAIDRRVLSESEPFYEGDGEFRVELPASPSPSLVALSVDELADLRERFAFAQSPRPPESGSARSPSTTRRSRRSSRSSPTGSSGN